MSAFGKALRLRLFIITISVSILSAPLLAAAPVFAQSGSAIAQQFQAINNEVTAASLVGIRKGKPGTIELSNTDNVRQLVGVVSNKPLIELSNGGTGTQVVTEGTTLALVSDVNGKVVAGDKVTASPISGIGMKAVEATVVVGTAQAALDSVANEIREITDKQGKKQTVHIGLIPLQVSVVSYLPETDSPSAFVPPFLQTLANTVTGKDVSPIRVLVAALVLLLLFLSVTVLLYSSVRSSIISIGRNPLSESAVRKSLLEVALTIFVVMVFAVGTVYLVLTV